MNGRSLRVWAAALLMNAFVACSSQPSASPAPDPTAALQSIPSADPAQYEHVQDMKKWRNPYLIVSRDGVVLFDIADNAEIKLKTDEVLPALARMPASNWPYGRVVVVADNMTNASAEDKVTIRRNKGIVGGILQGAHVAVKWVPSA